MTIKRLSSSFTHTDNAVVEYEIKGIDFSDVPYIVDRSHFVPRSEAIKKLTSAGSNGTDIPATYYDFPDGRDTGGKVPIDRSHDVKDLAEVSVALREMTEDLKTASEKARKRAERQKAFEDATKSTQPATTQPAASQPTTTQ